MSHDYRSRMLKTRSLLLLATFMTIGTVGPNLGFTGGLKADRDKDVAWVTDAP